MSICRGIRKRKRGAVVSDGILTIVERSPSNMAQANHIDFDERVLIKEQL